MCSVVVLAAGAGSRMHSSTPKVLHKLCGREMLYYSINEAMKISDDVSVLVFHHADKVEKMVRDNFIGVRCVRQDYHNLPGTGGAIMSFLQQYEPKHERLLILNGDMPLVCSDELRKFLDFGTESTVMSILELDDGSGYGRVILNGKKIIGIVEEKDATEQQRQITTVNAGVYLFPLPILRAYLPKLTNNNAQKEYYLTDIIHALLTDSKELVSLVVNEENFKGVNTKLDLSAAEEIMLHKIRTHWQKAGVRMHLPHTIYIDSRAQFSGECELESGAQILGACVLENAHIKAHSVVEDSKIVNSDVGPFAHIRPQCMIAQTHIGNFVETKKAILHGVKAGHLSYLGDCEIGSGSNIGAGVITCNYDGKQKHRTVIGKDVFIGSDTQLVAPVSVGDCVVVAAGSTITKDVASGALGISRTPQANMDGFYERFFGGIWGKQPVATANMESKAQTQLKINGEWQSVEKGLSVQGVLRNLGVDSKVVAIALNGEVLKKEQWSSHTPKEGDELELLHFVGGGRCLP